MPLSNGGRISHCDNLTQDHDIKGGAGDEAQHIAETGQFSRYKKTKISAKHYRSQYVVTSEKSKSDKGKIPMKGRNFGKLAHLKNLTLDIFFEIATHLQPLDILQLSRVSKQFRSIFASKSSRHIWVATKRNLAIEMLECPSDLSEPQYISLIFEHNCQACGKSRAPKIDYSLRVRFCGHCFDENVLKGTKVLKNIPKVSAEIFQLVPRSLLKQSYADYTFSNADNNLDNAYYFPEIEAVVAQYKSLESDSIALAAFVKGRKEIACRMMKDATALSEWVDSNRNNKIEEDRKHMEIRRASIEEKLVELGWDKKDFPHRYNYEWSKLLDQPRKLTPRIWKVIRPKLEALIGAELEEKARQELERRKELRRNELKPFWNAYLEEVGGSGGHVIIPHYLEACEFPIVEAMLYENDALVPLTQLRWEFMRENLSDELDTFRNKVLYTLTKRLAANSPNYGWNSRTPFDTPGLSESPDFSVLKHASCLFHCFQYYDCKDMIAGLSGILEHSHFKSLRWSDICGKVYGNPETEVVVQMVLKVLGLAENTTLDKMRMFDGKLLCLCGHPDHRQPKTFVSLISHILEENKFHKQKMEHYNHGIIDAEKHGIGLYNDHDIAAESFVALLSSDGNHATFKVEPEGGKSPIDDTAASFSSYDRKYCKFCFVLQKGYRHLKSLDEINYHMKAKHHREQVEAEDILKNYDLTDYRNTLI